MKDRPLSINLIREVLKPQPVTNLGVASQRPSSAAWNIGQYPVKRVLLGRRRRIAEPTLDALSKRS
jgi:hypothetical protein